MSISIDKRHQLQAREIETHPAQAEYLIHYGQKSEMLCGKMKIDSAFLKDRFGIILSKDRIEDLILIEPLETNQGFTLKKLTFRCTVEYKIPTGWKSMLISDTADISRKEQFKIGKYLFMIEMLSPVIEAPLQPSHTAIPHINPLAARSDPKITTYAKASQNLSLPTSSTRSTLPQITQTPAKQFGLRTQNFRTQSNNKENNTDQLDDGTWEYYSKIINDDSLWLSSSKKTKKSERDILAEEAMEFRKEQQQSGLKQNESTLKVSNHSSLAKQPENSNQKGFINPFRFSQGKSQLESQQHSLEVDNHAESVQKSGKVSIAKSINSDKSVLDMRNSPLPDKFRRRLQTEFAEKENAEEDEEEIFSVGSKKVKKPTQRDVHIHKELESQINTNKDSEANSSRKKVARTSLKKKPLFSEHEEASNLSNSQGREEEQESFRLETPGRLSKLKNSQSPSKLPLRMDLEGNSNAKASPFRSVTKSHGTIFDDEEGEKNDDGDDAVSTARSHMSQNQLKALKQLVVDKREAAAKQSAGKITPSQIPKESCTICLSEISGDIGRLESCVHVFCFSCVFDWAKFANECPNCKRRFNEIVKYSEQNVRLESVPIKFKNQEYECDWEEVVMDNNADEHCYICRTADNPSVLLVCDVCQFKCCHIYCLNPPLERVPEDEWICDFCREQGRTRRGPGRPRRNNNAQPARRGSRRNNQGNQPLLESMFEADEQDEEDEEEEDESERPLTRQGSRTGTSGRRGAPRGRRGRGGGRTNTRRQQNQKEEEESSDSSTENSHRLVRSRTTMHSSPGRNRQQNRTPVRTESRTPVRGDSRTNSANRTNNKRNGGRNLERSRTGPASRRRNGE